MAYFADLTPYAYILGPYTEQPDALNVGWLEYPHPFPQGVVPADAIAALRALVANPVNLCRGSQACNLQGCDYRPWGNGEIRVTGTDGVTYAAPVLILHYVEVHGYQPPKAFIDALVGYHGTQPVSEASGSAQSEAPKSSPSND